MISISKQIKELSVGEVAARSGIPISTLHYYEKEELINSRRTSGNQRRYTRDVLRRLGIIKAAQRVGIPLSDIRQALSVIPQGKIASNADWQKLATSWQADLDDRIARLSLLRERLTGCIGCGCLSIDMCDLFNPNDEEGQKGGGAHFMEPE